MSRFACRRPSVCGVSKQIAERDVDRHLTAFGGKPSECARNVEYESTALESETDGSARISAPVVTNVSRAEVNFPLIHDVGSEAYRLPAERPRVDVAARRAKLGILHVVVDEFEPVHRAHLDLRWKRITLIRFSRIESSSEIPYRGAEGERRPNHNLILRAEIHCPRALYLGTDTAALPRAVDAKLHDFIVKARAEPLRHVPRVCAGEHDVPGQNDTDDLVELVGHLLLADVENVQ